MKYFPHVLIGLAVVFQYFYPLSFVPIIVAGCIYVAAEFMNGIKEDDVERIVQRFEDEYQGYVDGVNEHMVEQQKVIDSQKEIIEQLRVAVGHRTLK